MDAESHETLIKVLNHQRIGTGILSQHLQPTSHRPGSSGQQKGEQDSPASPTHSPIPRPVSAAAAGASPHITTPPPTQRHQQDDVFDQWSMFDIDAAPAEDGAKTQLDCWLDSYDPNVAAFPELSWDATNQHLSEEDASQSFSYSERVREIGGSSARADDAASLQALGYGSIIAEKASSDTDNTEALFDQLSERIGSLHIETGGRIRYYGPTSTFSLVNMPSPPETLTAHQTMTADGQDILNRFDLDKPVPTALEEHLTKLYFTWQDPSLHIVDQQMFELARARWRNREHSPFYGESLRNAMYVNNSSSLLDISC